MVLKRFVSAGLCVATLTAAGAALSQEHRYSAYEQDVIGEVLAETRGEIEPNPDGKVIESILVYRLKVFDHRDPVPRWVNVLHRTSRERVILRELLFTAGDRYDAELVAESARNLRDITQVSLVLAVPLRGTTTDRVCVVVITKDIWSLRAAWDPEVTSDGISEMKLAADEINLAGQHKTVSARGGFDQGSYYYGAGYQDPRVAGSRIFASTSAALVFDRRDGRPEGSFGWFWYGQELFSIDAKWGWGVFAAWRDDVERSYQGFGQRTYNATVTPENDHIPYEWERGVWYATNEVVRSFGRDSKLDIASGFEALRGEYMTTAVSNAQYRPAAMREFRANEVPPNHQRINPFFEVRAHSTRFLRTLDVDTLALQEDVQIGHDTTLRVYPATSAIGSTRDLFGLAVSSAYTVPLSDGFVRAIGATTVELAGERSDVLFTGRLHLTTPRLGFGRFVYDAFAAHRYRDYYKERFVLGGVDRLRGYSSNFRRGKDVVASTFEFRTTSVGLLGVELGAAAFYDAGDAADGFAAMDLRQSVGGGARLLFPMFDRTVFRVDVGFPVDRDRQDATADGRRKTWGFVFSFEQAIPVPSTRASRTPTALAL
jgi:hypothetical protein